MKKIIATVICLAALAFAMCSCSDGKSFADSDNLLNKYERSKDTAKTYNYSDGAVNPPSDYATFSNEISDFTLRMFRNYNKSSDGSSYVFSPAVTALQLGLVSNGASGETCDEIIGVLSKSLELDELNQCMSYFKSRLETVGTAESDDSNAESENNEEKDNHNFVKLGTNLLVNDISDVKSKFVQTDADYYGCDIFRFMFDDDNAVTKVNGLFSDFTEDNAFSKLDSEQTLVSATSSDICDSWLNAYAKTDLKDGLFKSSNGENDVTYMTSGETYMKTENAQAILKYTADTPLKFMAILPNEGIDIDGYIADFTNLELSKLFDSVDFSKSASAVIPEFSIKSDSKADDITSVLEDSGLYTLFSEKAEFDGLTRTDDFEFNAMYELMPQFSVNSCGIGGTQKKGDEPLLKEHTAKAQKTDVTVEFNKPFIFLVLDNESNIPVYIGTYRG